MLILVIVLGILLVISGLASVLLYKAGVRHLEENELLKTWVSEFKSDVKNTYIEMKAIDDRNIFEKDDEVGVIFQSLVELVQKLNERTQNEEE